MSMSILTTTTINVYRGWLQTTTIIPLDSPQWQITTTEADRNTNPFMGQAQIFDNINIFNGIPDLFDIKRQKYIWLIFRNTTYYYKHFVLILKKKITQHFYLLQVLNQAILLNSAYNIPCARIKAFLCKTNTPSSTAFRGFGAPQRLFFIENVISKISYAVGKPLNMVSMYIVHNLIIL